MEGEFRQGLSMIEGGASYNPEKTILVPLMSADSSDTSHSPQGLAGVLAHWV